MRVLFLVTRPPFPPLRGDQVRSYHLLRHLAGEHEVTLVIVGRTTPGQALAAISALGVQVRHLPVGVVTGVARMGRALWDRRPVQVLPFDDARLRERVTDLAVGHDLVHGHLVRVAPLLPDTAPVVVDLVDALSLNLRRRAEHDRGLTRWAARREAERLAHYEDDVIARSAATLVSSAEDAGYLGGTAVVVPNGVDLERFAFRAGPRPRPTVVFAGNLGYFPNVDAARLLADEIMPGLRTVVPDAHLVLAGARPARVVRRLGGPSVTVTVQPADLGAVVAEAAVTVVPVRAGSGIQNKILEAMAVGTPVVTTGRAAAAVGATDGEHLLVAESPREFAEAAHRVLIDGALAERLRRSGRDLVTDRFTWERAAAAVSAVWNRVATRG